MQKLVSWAVARNDETSLRCFVDHPITVHTGSINGQLWQDRLAGSGHLVGHFIAAITQ